MGHDPSPPWIWNYFHYYKAQALYLKNIESFCACLYTWITINCVDHNKLENSERDGIADHPTCFLRNLYAGQEATELDMEQQTGSK